jgi:putative transport protein
MQRLSARGVYLRKITRGATATTIPILPNTQLQRGDIVTLVGRTSDTGAAAKLFGVADRAMDVADVAFIGAGIAVGAPVGALVLTLSATLFSRSGAWSSSCFCRDVFLKGEKHGSHETPKIRDVRPVRD